MHEPVRGPAKRVAVIRNPRAGTAPDASMLDRAVRQSIPDASILDTPEGEAFDDWLDRVTVNHDVLVAAGGDGTVAAVARTAIAAGKTLAIIPAGTLNHFARDAGIPSELDEAVSVLARGVERGVDVGMVNGRMFLNAVSLGNYPRMVHAREALERRGRSRAVASAVAIARTWWHLRKVAVRLRIDDRDFVRRSPFIVIANGSYVLAGLSLSRREQINDGSLSLYIAPPVGRIGVLSLPFRALAGTLERHEQFESIRATTIAASFSRPRIVAAIDGEIRELDTPLRFEVRRRALRMLLP